MADTDLKELFKLGAHLGYSRSRQHPSVSDFVFGFKNQLAIINLEKTLDQLARAAEFLTAAGQAGKIVLFVGNKPETQTIMRTRAKELGQPFVAGRWIGGTLTNFAEIRKRIDHYLDLKTKQEKGELAVYTKKEQLLISREMTKLFNAFEGILTMTKMPAVIVTVDPAAEAIAVREAKRLNIPVVSLANSDCDITDLDYPIVANDAAPAAIAYFIDRLAVAYHEGELSAKPAVAEPPADKQ